VSTLISLDDFDFEQLRCSSTKEEVDLLLKNKPTTLFAASRLPGIRPTTILSIQLLIRNKKAVPKENSA